MGWNVTSWAPCSKFPLWLTLWEMKQSFRKYFKDCISLPLQNNLMCLYFTHDIPSEDLETRIKNEHRANKENSGMLRFSELQANVWKYALIHTATDDFHPESLGSAEPPASSHPPSALLCAPSSQHPAWKIHRFPLTACKWAPGSCCSASASRVPWNSSLFELEHIFWKKRSSWFKMFQCGKVRYKLWEIISKAN